MQAHGRHVTHSHGSKRPTETCRRASTETPKGNSRTTGSFYIDEHGKKVCHGPEITWHSNGRKSKEVQYVDGVRHGREIQWGWSGDKIEEGTWERGKRAGRWIEWYSSGKKRSECLYKNDQIVGTQKFWSDGKLVREDRYEWACLREVTTWHENGQKRMHGKISFLKELNLEDIFTPPPKDGVWTYWNEQGQVMAGNLERRQAGGGRLRNSRARRCRQLGRN